MLFLFGFFAGFTAIVLILIVWTFIKDMHSKPGNDRHFKLLEEQLRVFNERMVEERRLACALEIIVERVTASNSTK
jgi:hypothetical protein